MDLKILDTGYVYNGTITGNAQTQLSDDKRAGYTGTAVAAISLKVMSLTLSRDVNLEKKPIVNTTIEANTSLVSINNRRIAVNAIVSKVPVTTGWNKNNIVQIARLDTTKGLKLLYPTLTTDINKTLVETLGAENTGSYFSSAAPTEDSGTVSTTTPYLIGRVTNLELTDTSDGNFFRLGFNFELTG